MGHGARVGDGDGVGPGVDPRGSGPGPGEEVWVPGGNLLLTTQVLTHKPHDTQ